MIHIGIRSAVSGWVHSGVAEVDVGDRRPRVAGTRCPGGGRCAGGRRACRWREPLGRVVDALHPVVDRGCLRSSSRRGSSAGSARSSSTRSVTQPTTASGCSGKVGTPGRRVPRRRGRRACAEPRRTPAATATQSATGGTGLVVPHRQAEVGGRQPAAVGVDGDGGGARHPARSRSTTSTSAASKACDGAFSLTHTRPASVSTCATTDQNLTRSRTTGAVARTPAPASAGSQPRLEVRQPLGARATGRAGHAQARRSPTQAIASA